MNTAHRTVRTMCPMNCHPTFCGMLATVDNDRLVEIKGDKDNPDSRGFLCVRGQAAHQILDNPKRLLHPLVRDNRGDAFRQASWDEALDRIVDGMQSVGREAVGLWLGHGVLSNDYGTFANIQLIIRLANMYGCQWWDGSMICWGLGGFGVGLTGAMEINTKEDMSENAELILLWGSNFASQPNTARHLTAAKKRGAHVVAIDVRVSEACRSANEYFIVRPGTDAALALAMMQVIVAEGLHDRDFIARHSVGFAELEAELPNYTPEWAAGITGIDAGRIVALARRYGASKRAMILLSGSSMYKDRNGWQASRTISCLPPLTGNLGRPGAGFGPRHAGDAHGFRLGDIVNFPARPPGKYLPVQMSAIIDACVDGRLEAMLLFGTNMLSSFADSGRLAQGLDRMKLVVSHDLFMNETARRCADVVLPATAWLEDIGCKATTTHLYLMDRALPPAGEARSMARVARDLAERLDIADFYPWDTEYGHIDAVLDAPTTGHATIDALRAGDGIKALNVSHVGHPTLEFATPSGKIEFYSSRAKESGLPPLPCYQPLPDDAEHPLQLRMGRTLDHFHSFYDHGRALPALARLNQTPQLWISPQDAAGRGIGQGDAIRLRNARGEMEAVAEVTDKVPAGTVWMHDGWPELNTLTYGDASLPDAATELFPFSTGQSGFDAMIEVERRAQRA